jgi:hypothetical protein
MRFAWVFWKKNLTFCLLLTVGTFRFRLNNYYNGTLLNNAAAITNLGTTVIRRTNNAQVTIVP